MSDDDPTPPQSADSHSARSKSAPAQSAQRLGLEPMPLKQAGLGLALLLYAISLALPGLHLRDYPPVEGYRILLTGWYGLMVLQVAWLANPLFAAAVIAAIRHRPRLAAGLAAALSMGDLGVVALFADPDFATLPLQIYRLMGAYRMEAAAAAALLLLILSMGAFWILDRGGRWHAEA